MDKTLTIERPAGLDAMQRDIQWRADTGQGIFDYTTAAPAQLQKLFELGRTVGGGATALVTMAKAYHALHGATVVVDAQVSRDLEVSAVTGTLAQLLWPQDSLELHFADPALPAMLLTRVGPDAALRAAQPGIIFAMDSKDASSHTLSMSELLWTEYLANQYDAAMSQRLSGDMPLTKEDESVMRYMSMLAVKVMAYASVPSLAPVELKTRAERKAAGLHPKRVSPAKVNLAVRYLPRTGRWSKGGTGDGTGGARQFKGRAGCIRHYSDERYINVRGTWQWIAPIPPPDGIKVVYKVVRRPAA